MKYAAVVIAPDYSISISVKYKIGQTKTRKWRYRDFSHPEYMYLSVISWLIDTDIQKILTNDRNSFNRFRKLANKRRKTSFRLKAWKPRSVVVYPEDDTSEQVLESHVMKYGTVHI